MNITRSALVRSTTQYLTVHLFLTLISLPLLVAWGLPLSRLSLIGNFLFSPILFLFLLLSSAIFFLEIMHIPHGSLSWLLEKITSLWKIVLPLADSDTLYGFSKPPTWLLCLLTAIPFIFIAHPRMRAQKQRLIYLTLLFILSMILIDATSHHHALCIPIPYHGKELTLIHQNDKSVLIDPGCMGRHISSPSWVSYTLVPELILKTGRLHLDHLITLKPGIMTFEAIRTLCETVNIHHLYIPYMYGELVGPLRTAWGKLYHELQQHNTTIHRIYEEQPIELVEGTIKLTLQPHGKMNYRDITYAQIFLEGYIDNKPLKLSRENG